MNILCYFFGHTGDLTESGYHVCSRCGLHAYWSSRDVDPTVTHDYDNAGKVYTWFIVPVRNAYQRALALVPTRKADDDELPF